MMNQPEYLLAALSTLQGVVAEEPDFTACLRAASDAAQTCIGHKLCTFMLFDAANMEVQRLYSSDPDAYPPGGRKKKRDTAWGDLVLERGQPYIGRTADDIREHFNDHEVILRLGLQSILNMPVRVAGTTVGTMNLLHDANYYSEDQLPLAGLLTGIVAGRF